LVDLNFVEAKIAKENELGRELNSEEEVEIFENEIKKMREENDPQIIVDEESLENHLASGWQFVSVLLSQRILIKKS